MIILVWMKTIKKMDDLEDFQKQENLLLNRGGESFHVHIRMTLKDSEHVLKKPLITSFLFRFNEETAHTRF